MQVGETWYVNVNLPHSVENLGATDRVHLVIDAVVNDWILAMLADNNSDTTITRARATRGHRVVASTATRPQETTTPEPGNPITATIITFLRSIGLPVQCAPLLEPTFLPGIAIIGGELIVDETRLQYPGDILHEAGHLAVAEPSRRAGIVGDAGADPAEEMMALAWSYAAGVYLDLDPAIVFHDQGYQGGASQLRESFVGGAAIGLPMLQWVGMALDARQAQARDLPAYPAMIAWLRPPA